MEEELASDIDVEAEVEINIDFTHNKVNCCMTLKEEMFVVMMKS